MLTSSTGDLMSEEFIQHWRLRGSVCACVCVIFQGQEVNPLDVCYADLPQSHSPWHWQTSETLMTLLYPQSGRKEERRKGRRGYKAR